MVKILNIESSTDICSISVSIDGVVKALVESDEPRVHSKMITILIKQCMDEAVWSFEELDAVAISTGPGSYTSLRIGATTAKGIAYAHRIPLIGICTLKALAAGVLLEQDEAIISMIDARRDEVYAAVHDEKMNELMSPTPHIFTENSFVELLESYSKIYLVGNGALKSVQWLKDEKYCLLEDHLCTSRNMAMLSFEAFKNEVFEDLAYFTPNYIKGANITKSKKPLF